MHQLSRYPSFAADFNILLNLKHYCSTASISFTSLFFCPTLLSAHKLQQHFFVNFVVFGHLTLFTARHFCAYTTAALQRIKRIAISAPTLFSSYYGHYMLGLQSIQTQHQLSLPRAVTVLRGYKETSTALLLLQFCRRPIAATVFSVCSTSTAAAVFMAQLL